MRYKIIHSLSIKFAATRVCNVENFLIYPYKHKYMLNRGLPLLKNLPAVVTSGVNAKLVIFTPKLRVTPHNLVHISPLNVTYICL